ncbi:MAG: tripartite tricarboxylate transporter substrate binding protein [Betaproteobacteria bacterium]|jgi:tripartite-type tricarboxylate transporter receptor subunit TctC
MNIPNRREFISTSLALSMPILTSEASAQNSTAWPQRTIKIVVPNPAGGSADLFPRLISEALMAKLGQTIVIENKPGAAGNIAAEFVYGSEPDGYTLMAAPPPPLSINVSLYPKLNYEPSKFVPITILSIVPNALMVHPSVPANSVQELIAFAKANPDKLSYASQGNGSTAHLTAELFKQKTGTKMVHVPYKGDAPAVADLLAGHVNVMFGNVAQASAHLRSGKLKVLAVTSAKRISSMPNTVAMQEIVPGVVAVAWFAMVAPPKTPAAIVNRLSSLIGEILRTPEMARRFAEVGAEPIGNTPEEMTLWMKEDTERWRQVIKNGGVTID